MVFLSLITRYFNEPFLEEFVEYYFSEGVDVVYILFDVKSTIPISQKIIDCPRIFIIQSYNFGDGDDLWKDTNKLYSKIRHTSEWFIYIDCDEFINTRKNPQNTIRYELETTFQNADCILVPWIMMSCNKRQNDPKSILQEITYRWDHNRRHPHPNRWKKGHCRYASIGVKSIFRGKHFYHITDHCPTKPNHSVACVDGIYNSAHPISTVYFNLRENDIQNAIMICHHYRVISYESCVRKFTNNGIVDYNGDFQNLWICDYAEVMDDTLRNKSIQKFGQKY
jgi:hypothetical protein